jgi:hypothetical protein
MTPAEMVKKANALLEADGIPEVHPARHLLVNAWLILTYEERAKEKQGA